MNAKTSRRPVRVCYLIDKLSRAGTETQLLALIRTLNRDRVQPHLALLNAQGDSESRELEPRNCPILRLGLSSFRSWSVMSESARLYGFLRKYRIDVLQVYFLDSTYLGVPLARLAGVKRVVRVRNNLGYWLTPTHRQLGRVMNRLSDVTLTNCENARRELLKAEGGPTHKVRVIENGVDLGRFADAPPPDTGRASVVRIGAVANLRPVKGLDVLVKAASQLSAIYPKVTFQVAGEGEERENLLEQIAELRLAGRFQLLGAVADVPTFLARQDIAVLPSRSEGMSNALLEYMAAGRAVVATAVGGNVNLVEDGRTGLLVPPEDPTALAKAIGRLLSQPDLARRLGNAARDSVAERFGRDAMRRRFEDFYERLIFAGPPRAFISAKRAS